MRIYICHQYQNKKENKQHIEKIIKALIKNETSYNTYISPVHTFGFLYNDVDYKTGITYCLELLQTCDIMYCFNGFSNSIGCSIEKQFARDNAIPIQYFDVNRDCGVA